MTNTSPVLIKTTPNPISYLFGAAGFFLFASIALYIFCSHSTLPHQLDSNADNIIFYLILGIFIFFSLWSLLIILKSKIVVLTDLELIIQQPLLLLKKTILLNKILSIEEKEFKVTPQVKRKTYEIHNGQQCIINVDNNSQIKLNSFEVLEYEDLIKKLFIVTDPARDNETKLKMMV